MTSTKGREKINKLINEKVQLYDDLIPIDQNTLEVPHKPKMCLFKGSAKHWGIQYKRDDFVMYIGNDIKNRMNLLDISAIELSELSFVDLNEINSIIKNEIPLENIDDYHLDLISSALHCTADFWEDENVKAKDLLASSMNQGIDDKKSLKVKAKLQDFLNSFSVTCEFLIHEKESIYQPVHSSTIKNALYEAKEMFNIKDFPGNLFNILNISENIKLHRLALFKENLGSLSGFVGYGTNDVSLICINYNRSIGHQNFTMAHELGHWMMHYGTGMSDVDVYNTSENQAEVEANNFAFELLYPSFLFDDDYSIIEQNDLLNNNRRKQFAIFINELCHKYCVSFDFVLRRILYKSKQEDKYSIIKKEITNDLGRNIYDYFDKDFYIPNPYSFNYQQLTTSYQELIKVLDDLVSREIIGLPTVKAIKCTNKIIE